MTVYVVGQLDIRDIAAYQRYLDGFTEIFDRHGGTLLATSAQRTHILEGEWSAPRTVLMSFPDLAAARAWYDDPDYRELMKVRLRTARTNLVVVEGLPGRLVPSA